MTNNARAVLIGVDDYCTFDSGGRRNLPGSVNDVRAWWSVCHSLGFQPENVLVFASPAPGAPALTLPAGVRVMQATSQNILTGLAWLGQGADGGLLTYSGHGYVVDTVLAICPTDITADGAGAIDFPTLCRTLGNADGLTVVLDCCFAGAEQRNVLSLNRKPLPPSLAQSLTPSPGHRALATSILGGRMLTACAANELAYQAEFAGHFHGAFTWALTSLLLQWSKVQQDESTVRLDVSYGTARDTAAKLLSTLSYQQTPSIAPSQALQMAFLQTGDVIQPTSPTPDAQVRPLQLDPGVFQVRYYVVTDQSGNTVAYILVPASSGSYNGTTYYAGYEYWFSVAHTPLSATKLTFTWTDYYWSGTSPVIPSTLPLSSRSFNMVQDVTFYSSAYAPNQSSTSYVNTNLNIAVDFGSLAYSSTSPHWSGYLLWYDTTGRDTVFGGRVSSPQTLTANTNDTNAVNWYSASPSVLSST